MTIPYAQESDVAVHGGPTAVAGRVSPAYEVCFADLEPFSELVVQTKNTRYHMTVMNPTNYKVTIQGGRFATPARGIFRGCSFGAGRLLKPGCIRQGMHMEIVADGKHVITSQVSEISRVA